MTAEDDYPADGARGGTAELAGGMYEKMCAEIDQLRADCARFREHSIILNSVAWRIAVALGRVTGGETTVFSDVEGDLEALISRLRKGAS